MSANFQSRGSGTLIASSVTMIFRWTVPLITATAILLTPPPAVAKSSEKSPPPQPAPKNKVAGPPGEAEFNECLKVPGGRKVKVTLKNPAELRDLVAWISSMTCKRLVVPASLQGQPVSFVSPTPLTPQEAYRGFLSALEVMGLTVVASGSFLKIIQNTWAVQSPVRTLGERERGQLGDSDEVVTQLLRLREARVDQVLPVLQKLRSRAGDVSSFGPGNLLILTDTAGNVRRMLKLLSQLDIPIGGAEIWVVQPEHADPAELAKLLGEIFSPGGSTASAPVPTVRTTEAAPATPQQSAVRFLADSGSGALIVIGSEPAFRRVQSLLKVLDVGGEATRSQAWVYRLKHGMAEQLASALGAMVSGGGGRGAGRNAAAAAASPFEGQVRVNAEPSSNSLLIMASPRDYLQVRRVIEEIDKPRRQIFVEAYILEVQLDRDRNVGLVGHFGARPGDTSVLLGTSLGPGFNSVSPDPLQLMGLALGVQGAPVPGTSQLFGKDIPVFGVVLQALQNDKNINLLSSPAVLATENEEAEIQVGENIPIRGAMAGANLPQGQSGGQLNLLAALAPPVDRRNVGLGLKILPTVSGEDRIRIKLRQEISAVAKEDFGGLGASTQQRLITSVITLGDQQTVVIGGLITEQQSITHTKVPVLGDIPLLGRLFRREGKETKRRNLLLVLTPYLIRDDSDMRRICRKKIEERQTFLRRYSQLRGLDPVVEIDFRYKRGLLGEINRTGQEVEAEAKLAGQAKGAQSRPAITPIP